MKGMVIQDMKKMFHRIGALAVALMMALSMAAPAMAATSNLAPRDNTVQVNYAVPGATYSLYKLLQLDGTVKTEGESTTIVTYRYSYDTALEGIISAVVELPQFKYRTTAEKTELAKTDKETAEKIIHPDYGFKVVGQNVTFITPETSDGGEYSQNETVKTMMVAFADELRKRIDNNGTPLEPFALPAVYADDDTAHEKNLNPNPVAAPAATGDKTTSTVTFRKVPNGYWMVTSNAGARSIVFTSPEKANISQEVTVDEKNPAPTVEKRVLDVDNVNGDVSVEDGKGSWQDANDAQIGDEVDFQITVELYKGAENIIVYDKMSTGLTFKGLKGVKFYPRTNATTYNRSVYKFGGTEETTELELTETNASKNVVLKADVGSLSVDADKHGFELTFKNAFTNPAEGAANRDESESRNNVFLGNLANLEDDGGRVEITYTAVLNQEAVSGEAGNTNKSYAAYGHIPGVEPGKEPGSGQTPPHKTSEDETASVHTYEFSIDKFVEGSSTAKLEGAKFQLRGSFIGISNTDMTEANKVNRDKYAWVDDDNNLKLPAEDYVISDNPIALVDISGEPDTGKVYRVATPEEIAADAGKPEKEKTTTTTIETDKSGKITVKGLNSMLYSITETAAPAGYNKLGDPVMIAIGSAFSGKGGIVFKEDTIVKPSGVNGNTYLFKPLTGDQPTTVGIGNASGIQLPTTGGIGTTIFYVVGITLALGASVLLVVKKRGGRTED